MNRTFLSARTYLARAFCILLDVSILTLLAVVVLVVLTGGGVVEWGGLRVRARSVENPILIAAVAVALRYAARRWSPFMGIARLPIETLTAAGLRFTRDWIPAHVARLFTRPLVALGAIGFVAFLVKVLLAWQSPGFFSGDDVEIHEMSMGALLGQKWPIWELRSAFFPMLFIYPAQRLALALGAVAPETLVLSGRVVVALLSSAAIPLTWLAARRLAPADPRLAALAVAFITLNKLQMSFGSSELPRPVSTVFVAAAFLCTLREWRLAPAAAGLLLGVAAAFRFSEVVFVPAALVTLPRDRYWSRVAILLLTATLTAAGIVAISDALYWGTPFSSIVAAIDYTLGAAAILPRLSAALGIPHDHPVVVDVHVRRPCGRRKRATLLGQLVALDPVCTFEPLAAQREPLSHSGHSVLVDRGGTRVPASYRLDPPLADRAGLAPVGARAVRPASAALCLA